VESAVSILKTVSLHEAKATVPISFTQPVHYQPHGSDQSGEI